MFFDSFKSSQFLILGVSTDIGKTYFTCKICEKLSENNIDVNAIKPVASGFDDAFITESDAAKILKSLKQEINLENIDKINPFRFLAPLSIPTSASLEGKDIDFEEVKKFCQEKIDFAKKNNQTLLIEGAGGVMSPINYQKTFLDLAKDLKIPVILISASYLGAVSQTLCTIEALKAQKITPKFVIINKNLQNNEVKIEDIIFEIKKFTKIPVFFIDNFFNNCDNAKNFL